MSNYPFDGQKSPAVSFFLSSWESVQHQVSCCSHVPAAVRMFLLLFGFG